MEKSENKNSFKEGTPSCRLIEVNNAIEIALKNDNFEIRAYTDLSELKDDVIYAAFKVLGRPKRYYH